ncbi:MAG: stage IV sporulation protein A [Firmicutes bacterium]|nr:stage IV sporulation protein A [Bacillota bacterium]
MDRNLYSDIAERTGGEIHVGVVGPVRSGKSTFIKRFMELFVIPGIENPYMRTRVVDQLPQSGDGRTITTTEPKFVPEEAVKIKINHTDLSLRMVDSVGYLIPGVLGHMEEGRERMVRTPWDVDGIPFAQAAERGTEKVITDHATVGILVTTDGSIGELPRENYVQAEEKTVMQLSSLQKPFVIVLNSKQPGNSETQALAKTMEEKYCVPVIVADCSSMDRKVPEELFKALLYQFPVCEVAVDLPEYMDALPFDHPMKSSLVETFVNWMGNIGTMSGIEETLSMIMSNPNINMVNISRMDMAIGQVCLDLQLKDGLYYQIIGDLLGREVTGDKELFLLLKDYADAKVSYDDMSGALYNVHTSGYGIVHPKLEQMELGKPEVFKQGSKYGVRMVASAPCLHMIKTTVNTEIAPLVGSEQQSEDLANYLMAKYDSDEGNQELWETNLFGKSLKDLVREQMDSKLTSVPDTLQFKVQRSLQKISDEGKDYFICILI